MSGSTLVMGHFLPLICIYSASPGRYVEGYGIVHYVFCFTILTDSGCITPNFLWSNLLKRNL